MSTTRKYGAVLVAIVLAAALAGCQTAKVGSRCKGNGFAQRGDQVLVCRGGRWQRLMSKRDAAALLQRLLAERPAATTTPSTTTTAPAAAGARWSWNGSSWVPQGTPPTCPSPVQVATPINLSLATAVLYPGQVRGGDFKPHGGFLFAGRAPSDITVTAPFTGRLVRAARYLEMGDEQTLLEIQHPCGIMVRFDHIKTLSPTLATALAGVAVRMDSQTTNVDVAIAEGQVLATAVGFTSGPTTVDFGAYDLRTKNTKALTDPAWAASHGAELAHHGRCWFDWLNPTDKAAVLAKPAGDMVSGSTSDYC